MQLPLCISATKVEIHWRSKQTSDHGTHQRKGEYQILIASRKDILPFLFGFDDKIISPVAALPDFVSVKIIAS
jgi:hypothetical protein